MTLDPYQPCPCGSGKKIKFCCCKDIQTELDKVIRTIEGQQRKAAHEHIQRVIDAKGERAALLLFRSTIELQLGEAEQAETSIARLQELAGVNSVNLALQAIVQAVQGKTVEGIQSLQQSISSAEDPWPGEIIDAIDVLAQSLLALGDVPAARGHLFLLADAVEGEMRDQALLRLMRIGTSRSVPLLLKQELTFAEPAADAPWRGAFESAMQTAAYGAWQEAIEELQALARDYPQESAVRKCIAYVRGWLGDTAATAAAWRELAALESLPLEDRVEAEAMAQLVDPVAGEDAVIDQMRVTYEVQNVETLMERLLSQRSLVSLPFNPAELAHDDQPPPKALFLLLNRDRPEAERAPGIDDVPEVIGMLLVFGRQTDRSARLELADVRPRQLEGAQQRLAELLGDAISQPGQQEVLGKVSAEFDQQEQYWLPPRLELADRRRIEQELYRRDTLVKFPQLPQPALGGKSLEQAAEDESLRIPALAVLLLRELNDDRGDLFPGVVDIDELRDRLKLPRLEPIEPDDNFDARRLPLTRSRRVTAERLSSDDLNLLFNRAARVADNAALRDLAAEVIRREATSEQQQTDKLVAYRTLANVWSHDPEQAIVYLQEGRKLAVKLGRSPAEFLLAELPQAVISGNVQRFQQITTELQTRHINEPGVKEQLVSILVRLGILRPDGSPATPRQPAAAEPAAAPPQQQRIWTPDGDAGALPASGEKSKLWVPGMD